MSNIDFIKKIATYAQNEYKSRSKSILPSVCIAQACLETGYGSSSLMTKANAYFGIKWTKGCGFDAYSGKTKEVYDGKTCTLTAAFRAYKTPADSVKDYYDLLCNNDRYKKAVGEKDYIKAITAIKNGGYATDPDYVNKIVSVIKSNNLTKYDKVQTKKKSIDEVAKEVIAGKYGDGSARKIKLISEGYNYNEVQKKVTELLKVKNKNKVSYYKKYTGKSVSLVDALNSLKINSSVNNRTKIAKANGISNYKLTTEQNTKLLDLLKQGKLKKPN